MEIVEQRLGKIISVHLDAGIAVIVVVVLLGLRSLGLYKGRSK